MFSKNVFFKGLFVSISALAITACSGKVDTTEDGTGLQRDNRYFVADADSRGQLAPMPPATADAQNADMIIMADPLAAQIVPMEPMLDAARASDVQYPNLVQVGCPVFAARPDIRSISFFDQNDKQNLVARAVIQDIRGRCSFTPDNNSIALDLSIIMDAALGKQGRYQSDQRVEALQSFPYSVTMTDRFGNQQFKKIYAAIISFQPFSDAAQHIEQLRQFIPVPQGMNAQDLQIEVGFQLSPTQLAYNRGQTLLPQRFDAQGDVATMNYDARNQWPLSQSVNNQRMMQDASMNAAPIPQPLNDTAPNTIPQPLYNTPSTNIQQQQPTQTPVMQMPSNVVSNWDSSSGYNPYGQNASIQPLTHQMDSSAFNSANAAPQAMAHNNSFNAYEGSNTPRVVHMQNAPATAQIPQYYDYQAPINAGPESNPTGVYTSRRGGRFLGGRGRISPDPLNDMFGGRTEIE